MSRVRWGLKLTSPDESIRYFIKLIHQYTQRVTYERVMGREEPGSTQPQTKQILEHGDPLHRKNLLGLEK